MSLIIESENVYIYNMHNYRCIKDVRLWTKRQTNREKIQTLFNKAEGMELFISRQSKKMGGEPIVCSDI